MWKTLSHLIGDVVPKLYGHHLCHVASESVDTLCGPEQKYVRHLAPCARYRIEVVTSAIGIAVINAVIQLHGFIPVVYSGVRIEMIIARGLGRRFFVTCTRCNCTEVKRFAPAIIKVIAWREMQGRVVVLPQIAHSRWFAD